MSSVLQVESLSFSYPDGTEVLEDFSFDLSQNEIITVVGPSGCGKSTLLRIIAGLLTDFKGTIEFSESRPQENERPNIGMMFQNYALFDWRTVRGNVKLGLESRDTPKSEYDEIITDFLEMTKLEDFGDHYPTQLSGGMKQRVALARILAYDPQIILMDEPLGALDAWTREKMQTELLRILRLSEQSVILVTHDVHEAVFLGDKVLVCSNRPAYVKDQIDIEFEDRDEDLKYSTNFNRVVRQVREQLIVEEE